MNVDNQVIFLNCDNRFIKYKILKKEIHIERDGSLDDAIMNHVCDYTPPADNVNKNLVISNKSGDIIIYGETIRNFETNAIPALNTKYFGFAVEVFDKKDNSRVWRWLGMDCTRLEVSGGKDVDDLWSESVSENDTPFGKMYTHLCK